VYKRQLRPFFIPGSDKIFAWLFKSLNLYETDELPLGRVIPSSA